MISHINTIINRIGNNNRKTKKIARHIFICAKSYKKTSLILAQDER